LEGNRTAAAVEELVLGRMAITLTKEQAAQLIPLLSRAVEENSDLSEEGPNYTIAEMFEKKKNTRSTPAQIYLLVSLEE